MRILLDENLSWRAASALREVDLDCGAVGDESCPPRTTPDREIVHWCHEQRRLLVTADMSRKSPEMREAIERYRLPVVQLRRSPEAVPLLRGLLNAWEGIGEAWGRAVRQDQHLRLNLDPVTGSISRVRRGEGTEGRASRAAASIGPCDRPL